jgi:two-component system, OmpR family, response regulator ParR
MEATRECTLAGALEELGCRVAGVYGIDAALDRLRSEDPGLIVAWGHMTPALCRDLRRWTAAPLLVLLPQGNSTDAMEMLDAGADDCQPAGIGRLEAVMRVRILLQRSQAGAPEET